MVSPPVQPLCQDVLLRKYAKGSEQSVADVQYRVAQALAQAEAPAQRAHWQDQFLRTMQAGFVPAGRIMASAGVAMQATLINCFVHPIGDSITHDEDGLPGIFTALAQAMETMRLGGGVGYDFSPIRPCGSLVHGTGGIAAGPLAYMAVFDQACETVLSAGARRGAQMGVLRGDHPDIESFVHAKDQGQLRNFNLSIGVTDAFMQAVEHNGPIELIHPARPSPRQIDQGARQRPDGQWIYRTVAARHLWQQVMRATYDHAEPGVLFLDRINADNNLAYCEHIDATNPCAEQPLPPYGSCCLGSIDLTRLVRHPFEQGAVFDLEAFRVIIGHAVRMLDNVLDLTQWPLARQREEAHCKRRIGLGVTGLGDALVMLNLPYHTPEAQHMAQRVAHTLRDASYLASCELAAERGAFPLFQAPAFLRAPHFASRLPESIQQTIRRQGIRHSHLLSIAPAGTISLAFCDNVSNGIEPPFAWTYQRQIRRDDGGFDRLTVQDHAWRLYRQLKGADAPLTPAFVTARELDADAHLNMVAAMAPYIDSAISKTVNVSAAYPYERFESLYLKAWKVPLKGLSTYRPNTVLGEVLSESPQAGPNAPQPDTACNSLGEGCPMQ